MSLLSKSCSQPFLNLSFFLALKVYEFIETVHTTGEARSVSTGWFPEEEGVENGRAGVGVDRKGRKGGKAMLVFFHC